MRSNLKSILDVKKCIWKVKRESHVVVDPCTCYPSLSSGCWQPCSFCLWSVTARCSRVAGLRFHVFQRSCRHVHVNGVVFSGGFLSWPSVVDYNGSDDQEWNHLLIDCLLLLSASFQRTFPSAETRILIIFDSSFNFWTEMFTFWHGTFWYTFYILAGYNNVLLHLRQCLVNCKFTVCSVCSWLTIIAKNFVDISW